MENKKCSQMMEKYLELDKNTRLPVSVTTHLLFCKECRSKILLLSKAQKLTSQILKISSPVTDQSIINVLEALPEDKIQKSRKNPINLTLWIIAGILMIALFIFPVFFTNKFYGETFSVSYALMISICVIIYCSTFVCCNMDFFVKKLNVKLVKSA